MGGHDRTPEPLTIMPSFAGDPDCISALVGPDGDWIVYANCDEEIAIPPEYQRLFAAAADMLQQLRKDACVLESYAVILGGSGAGIAGELAAFAAGVRATIARATGGTPGDE